MAPNMVLHVDLSIRPGKQGESFAVLDQYVIGIYEKPQTGLQWMAIANPLFCCAGRGFGDWTTALAWLSSWTDYPHKPSLKASMETWANALTSRLNGIGDSTLGSLRYELRHKKEWKDFKFTPVRFSQPGEGFWRLQSLDGNITELSPPLLQAVTTAYPQSPATHGPSDGKQQLRLI